ncbi:MAG: hypothetical protein GX660_13495 [Clostridiaceae bacterium]|nr:hypothetical protein [Clostridiaceae bacterium]
MENENEYNTKRIQESLLEILSDIDSVCRKNKINYSLYAGTLIGAIRHHGFIPWDDDADIVFERKEYEIFIKAFLNEMHGKYLIKNIVWVPRIVQLDENKSIEQSMYIYHQ